MENDLHQRSSLVLEPQRLQFIFNSPGTLIFNIAYGWTTEGQSPVNTHVCPWPTAWVIKLDQGSIKCIFASCTCPVEFPFGYYSLEMHSMNGLQNDLRGFYTHTLLLSKNILHEILCWCWILEFVDYRHLLLLLYVIFSSQTSWDMSGRSVLAEGSPIDWPPFLYGYSL